MVAPDFPLEFVVERVRPVSGGGVDIFGDPVPAAPETTLVEVFGWAQPDAAELATPHTTNRVQWDVNLYAATGDFCHTDRVRLDDGLYEVIGVANFEHNPWWAPGLEVVKLRQVEG